MILISLLEVFVTSGLGNALVQKKSVTTLDYSTVFYFNVALAVLIYIVIYIVAEPISSIYNSESLSNILRIMSLRVIIASLNTIQYAYIQRNMIFKQLFYSSLIGCGLSAFLGIAGAINGMGVYALVLQYLSNALINTVILFFIIKWTPTCEYSWASLAALFKYGWKLLVSGLLNTSFNEIKGIIIGGKYSASDLSYYDKGKQFPSIVYENINASISKVLFPIMSKEQDDKCRILDMTRVSLSILSYVLLPFLFLLYALGDDLIVLLITSKWLPALPYLRIACLTYSVVIINTVLTNAINSVGRSDLHLKIEVLNILLGIIMLLLLMNYGAIYIALSITISTMICSACRVYVVFRLFNYRLLDLWNNYFTSLVLSTVILILCLFIKLYLLDCTMRLIIIPPIFLILYWALSRCINTQSHILFMRILNKIRRNV